MDPNPRETSEPAKARPSAGSASPALGFGPFLLLSLLLALAVGATACLGGPTDPDEDVVNDPRLRAERIQNLREAIDKDHAMLQDLITVPRTEGEEPIYEDPRVREIAARMTEQVRRLERLRAVEEAERVTR